MLQNLYNVCPIFVQNVLISMYGYRVKAERFGEHYKKYYENIDLQLRPSDSEAEILKFLIDALEGVEYYKKLCIDVSPNDQLSVFLSKLPVLKKNVVKENANLFINKKYMKSNRIIYTSGSTGSPLAIYVNKNSLQKNYAFFHRFLSINGLSEFDRSATFAGRLIVPKEQISPPYWRENRALKTLLLSSYHLSSDTVSSYLDALENFRPTYIDSYPSAIYELSRLAIDRNLKCNFTLKGIITSSETLQDYQRECIESFFSCRVYDYYGCAEQSVLAFQSSFTGNYIVPSQYCLVEVVDSKGNPVGIGEQGKVVCTGLINSAMPLIRYEIGDEAIVEAYFGDSRFVSSLKCIVGRVDDVIVTPRGERVGRLDPVFKGVSGINECQVIQHSIDHITLKVVKTNGEDLDETILRSAFRARLGECFSIDIIYVEKIPRSRSGKFRSVISQLNDSGE